MFIARWRGIAASLAHDSSYGATTARQKSKHTTLTSKNTWYNFYTD
jgi:hypothetical protein